MARPVYIIAARGVIEDETTRLVSIFAIIERFEITRWPIGTASPEDVRATNLAVAQSVENTVFAVWMRQPGDENVHFEHQFAIISPASEQLTEVEQFQFTAAGAFHRFRLNMHGIPPITESSQFEIESRVRRQGETEWIRQSFPIVCDVVDAPPAANED